MLKQNNKILITGGNSYIAKSLYNALKDKYEITCITRQDFDLTNREKTNEWFKDKYFNTLIHTAITGGSRLKEDDGDVIYKNLLMHSNLLNNNLSYQKFINFGSGAELNSPTDPYGLSKAIIRESILPLPYHYNIRIFGVFDENELDTRFIKANLKRYINKQPMEIHQNKYMDFFYMEDLVSLIEFYILNDSLPKEINCTYSESRTLYHIADIINHLNNYKVDIKINKPNMEKEYIGKFTDLGIKYIGLQDGIKKVYKKLLK